MCGRVGLLGGGVGGMSPVMLTSASMPALRSLRAACGETLNMSSTWAARVGDDTSFSGLATSWSRGSAAGTGGGGGDGAELESLRWPASSGRDSRSAISRRVGSHEAGHNRYGDIRRAGSAGCSKVEKARPGRDATGNSRWFSSSLNRCSAAGDVQVQYYGAGGASTSPSRPGRLDGRVYPAPRQPQSHCLSCGILWEYGYLGCLVMRRCRSAVETVGPARGSSGQAARGKAWRGRKLEGNWENWGPSLARPCQGVSSFGGGKSGSALVNVSRR